jgi:hypothetical protein
MRVVIEQSFALLKGRFRRLKLLDIRNMKELNETVMMCCILHNILLVEGNFEFFTDQSPSEEDANSLEESEQDANADQNDKAEGEEKREWLRNYLQIN